jgi:hypothetical protein
MRLAANASARILGICSLIVASSGFVLPAHAQSDQERAGARAAANQGVTAFEAGNYQEALSLMERAESLVHALPHLLYIARANEKLGRLVEAREAYLKIGRERLKPTDPEVFREAQAAAAQELDVLEPRIPTVIVKVEGAEAGTLTVTMDGKPLAVALLGIPTPMNPGGHRFEARAPGMLPARQELTVAEGGQETVVLRLVASGEPAAAPSSSAGSPTSDSAPNLRPVPTSVYIGLAATGALAIGAGVVGTLALGNRSDFDDQNNGSDPVAAQETKDRGSTLNLVTDVLIGGAVVSAGITAILYFTRPTVAAQQASAPVRLAPAVLPGGAALSATGRF